MVSIRNNNQKAHKQNVLESTIPFPLPTKFCLKPIHPTLNTGLSHDLLLSTFNRTRISLANTGHIGIINPNNIPHYAAFRLHNIITPDQQSHLHDLVHEVSKTCLKSHTIKSRGAEFHQRWFGVWCRYAKHSILSADRRKKASETAVTNLLRAYDNIFGGRPAHFLHNIDSTTAHSSSTHHRPIFQYLRALGKDENTPKRTFEKTKNAVAGMGSAADVRLGGMGTMLAVSWGEGTDWHVDGKDYGNHYTIISVLGKAATLHLPELNYSIPILPGDVVGFLAHKYLHKLEPEASGSEGGEENEGKKAQIVFTCWTDDNTQQRMHEYRDYYVF